MNDRQIWTAALATYGIGDIATTHYGMSVPGVEEGHPISDQILGAGGTAGMVGTKALVFLVAIAVYRAAPAEHRVGIPIGLALLGTAVVGNNLSVISDALEAGGAA